MCLCVCACVCVYLNHVLFGTATDWFMEKFLFKRLSKKIEIKKKQSACCEDWDGQIDEAVC